MFNGWACASLKVFIFEIPDCGIPHFDPHLVWRWSWHETILVWTSSSTNDIPNNAGHINGSNLISVLKEVAGKCWNPRARLVLNVFSGPGIVKLNDLSRFQIELPFIHWKTQGPSLNAAGNDWLSRMKTPGKMTANLHSSTRRCAALANSPLAGFTFFTVFDWRLAFAKTRCGARFIMANQPSTTNPPLTYPPQK